MTKPGTTSPKLMASYVTLSNAGIHVVVGEDGNLRVIHRDQVVVLELKQAVALAHVMTVRLKALAVEGSQAATSSPKPSSADSATQGGAR